MPTIVGAFTCHNMLIVLSSSNEDAKDLIGTEHTEDENYKEDVGDFNFKAPIASGSKSENEINLPVFSK